TGRLGAEDYQSEEGTWVHGARQHRRARRAGATLSWRPSLSGPRGDACARGDRFLRSPRGTPGMPGGCPSGVRHVTPAIGPGTLPAPRGRRSPVFGLCTWIVVGLIVGAIARALFPGRQPMGWIGTAVLGMAGSLVGGFLSSLFWHGSIRVFHVGGLISSVI